MNLNLNSPEEANASLGEIFTAMGAQIKLAIAAQVQVESAQLLARLQTLERLLSPPQSNP
jgi:hypothetical protein